MAASSNNSLNYVGYKVDVDDTIQLSCTFEATETSADHIEYIIRVQRGTESKLFWTIRKRYREFDELNNALKSYNYDLKLPGKKLFGNMNKEFISDRQTGLQEYLERILSNHVLSNTIYVKSFLDDKNYNENYLEKSLEHVSMFFRSESKWQINETLNEFGWRFRKQYLIVNNSDDNKKKYLLSWCDYGPDKALRDTEYLGLLQQLSQIQHEYIQPIVKIYNSEFGVLLIQEYNEKGSLRDLLFNNTKIKNNYLKKYSIQKSYKALDISQIKSWSKQILETLNFIHSKGFFYGHLHTGNVLIEQNKIKLTDIHNSMLGVPYLYRSFVTQHKKIQTMENVDVYGYGHLLYEMIYGEPMNKSTQDTFQNCPFLEIRNILESILSKNALSKTGLPTISQLLALPFFADVKTENSSTIPSTFKFFSSSKYKDFIVKIKEQIEKRLNDEQKSLFKLSKKKQTEAKLLSEDEINKRRKEQKKAEGAQNSLEFPTSQETNEKPLVRQSSVQQPTSRPLSSTTATAASIAPPPPPPPPPAAPAPPPPPVAAAPPAGGGDRSQLLSSITGFSKGALKKTVTIDKSKPKI